MPNCKNCKMRSECWFFLQLENPGFCPSGKASYSDKAINRSGDKIIIPTESTGWRAKLSEFLQAHAQ